MKKAIAGILILAAGWSCQDNEASKNDFTGNETTYSLQAGSSYPVSGTITFREKTDGSTFALIVLTGTEGSLQHPVHLHLGDLSTPGAEIAALLNPVKGNTGKSETVFGQLADESLITYQQLIKLDACIKVHLAAAGPERDIVLAGGNIGEAASAVSNGRMEWGVCKSTIGN